MNGRVTSWLQLPTGVLIPQCSFANTELVSAGFAIAKTLGLGDTAYKINKMYVEFENSAGPVSVPSFTQFAGRDYYVNLAAPKDYLRVPLIGVPELGIASGYEAYFTAGTDGNKLTFISQTAGSAGVNGVTFSNALNSRVYGVALVAAPEDNDESQDVLVARGYYPVGQQQIKPAAGQLVITWEVSFVP